VYTKAVASPRAPIRTQVLNLLQTAATPMTEAQIEARLSHELELDHACVSAHLTRLLADGAILQSENGEYEARGRGSLYVDRAEHVRGVMDTVVDAGIRYIDEGASGGLCQAPRRGGGA